MNVGISRDVLGLTARLESDTENPEKQDTDNESLDQLQRHQFQQSQSNSFKRSVPAMGNRGLETRNSKRHLNSANTRAVGLTSGGGKNEVSVSVASTPTGGVATIPVVGALEVQNVKKAINRYGTLPKGARIGAYLESLRHPDDQSIATTTIHETSQSNGQPASQNVVSPKALIRAQPQMIRSNSSGGVTMVNSASASLNKLQRHRTTTDSSLITFSSFRNSSGSPKRNMQPSLADLEFPPPPIDLPPPPEEFENSPTHNIEDGVLAKLPPHPHSQQPNNDVSNTEPSVEEASTRFGVSLRKREPSTDSCSSLGSPADIIDSVNTPSVKEKLEMKLLAEIRERTASTKSDSTVAGESYFVNNTSKSALPPKPENHNSAQLNYKAQLKKVDPKKIMNNNKRGSGAVPPPADQKDELSNIIDFKSRLRKVQENQGNATDSTQGTSDSSCELLSSDDIILLPPPPPPPPKLLTPPTDDERANNGNTSQDYQSCRIIKSCELDGTKKTESDDMPACQYDHSSDEGEKIYLFLTSRY